MSKAPSKVSPELDTPTDLSPQATKKVSEALNVLLADAFALYLKTKNFHWHISGRHFRDYHLLLDEQSDAFAALRHTRRRDTLPQQRAAIWKDG